MRWIRKIQDSFCNTEGCTSMKVKQLCIIFFFGLIASACGQVRNSSSYDDLIYGSSISGSAQFVTMKTVLATQCIKCHAAWKDYTENDFVKNGLVIRGSASGSTLYTRIRGNDTGIAGDMPTANPNLSPDDMGKIKAWIVSL